MIFIFTDKCCLNLLSRKFLFPKDNGDNFRKPQLIKMQNCGTQFSCIHIQKTTPSSDVRDQFRKEYRKIVRTRESEGVLKTVSPKDIIEAIAMKSHQHDFLTISLNKDKNR